MEDAFAVADEIIKTNCQEFGHELLCVKGSCASGMLDRFFFLKGHGKIKDWAQTETQKITGNTDVKNRKQLENVTSSLELMGAGSSGPDGVKKENQKHADLKPKVENLRPMIHR